MKVAIILFPGTNCEGDTEYAFKLLGCQTQIIWHKQENFSADLVVLPGGFSYGDYLRTAAIAKFSPVIKSVVAHAKAGGYVLGICNGFQMLLELGLLPGAMRRNESMNFISKYQTLKVSANSNKFLSNFNLGEVVNIPVAHGEGNYFNDDMTLAKMYEKEQILLKYCDKNGTEINLNGSIDNIAGICDASKRIFGLMPHPERACEKILNSDDGLKMLKGLVC